MTMFNDLEKILEGDLAQSFKDFKLNLIAEYGEAGKALYHGHRFVGSIDEVNKVLFPIGSIVLVHGRIGLIAKRSRTNAWVGDQWERYIDLTILEVKEVAIKYIDKTGFNCSLGHVKTDKLSEVLQSMRDDRRVTVYRTKEGYYEYV